MRRVLKWVGRVLLVLILLPIVVVGAVLIALNTSAGQHEAERLLAGVLGDTVKVEGISGGIPGAPRVRHVELRDTNGVWLSVDDIALDWSPLRLVSGVAKIDTLTVGHVVVARAPVASQPSAPSPSNAPPFKLPVRVEVDALHVGRVDIGAPLAGVPASVGIDGTADVTSLTDAKADIGVRRLDGSGTYHVQGVIDATRLDAHLDVDEPSHGLVSGLAGLPELGALSVRARVAGPWTAAATDLALSAGPLRATAKGTVNVTGQAADLDVAASAPAMSPRPDVSWQSVALDAHVHGPFSKPDATGTLEVAGLSASGAGFRHLGADFGGNAGAVHLAASVEGLRIPGPKPGLLEADPLTLTADARLDASDKPVHFDLEHKLISAKGLAHVGEAIDAAVDLGLPDLAPLAAIGGVDLQGHTALTIKAAMADGTTRATIDGTLGLTGGLAPAPALIGPDARVGVSATVHGPDVTLSRLDVNGKAVTLGATGGLKNGVVGLDWTLALSDLSLLAPAVSGAIDGTGHVEGRTDDLSARADITGEVATRGYPKAPLKLALDAHGLPSAPTGTVTLEGAYEGAPVTLAAQAARAADGVLHVDIQRAAWKSAHAEGAVSLAPGAKLPQGKLSLRVDRLTDFDRLAGQPLAGSAELLAELSGDVARVHLGARNAGVPGSGASESSLDATVTDPLGRPRVQARLAIDGLHAAGAPSGSVRLDIDGPEDALGIKLATTLDDFQGSNLAVNAAGTFDVNASRIAIATTAVQWKGETLRLLAPAHVSLAGGLSVDRLRLGLRDAVLDVAGRVSPTLDLTVALRNVTPDLARIVAPDLQADGTLTLDAKITGTPVRPAGTIRLAASGLRMRTGPARSLPPAAITANATLGGETVRIDTRVTAGRNTITVTGTAPLQPSGPVNLRATGGIDLALLDPILSAQGRRVRGQVAIDAGVGGTLSAPRPTGTVRLANAEFQDFGQGARIEAINALIDATGESIRIASFSAKAGRGTLGASGTVGLAGDMPINVTLTAHDANPLSGDRLRASLDADLSVRGAVAGQMAARGTVKINSAEIRVPESMPSSFVTIPVRRPGDRPPPPPSTAPPPPIALDVTLDAPNRIFVRGRGLDAELEGKLHVGGTAAAPQISGGFKMRRGTFSLAGQTLTFTTGEVTFDGSGKIDPTLDFVIESTSNNVTATITVSGYASAPKIALSSTPSLPQDEVLAQLLFHQSASSLGPLQLAEIGAALAQISGVGGGGFDPLNSVRQGLGLDRLSVGGGSNGTSPSVEAGRYVAPGVYVGAKQGTSGGGTQATVQIDITKGLKLETDVGAGGTSTGTGASNSSSGTNIGLTYQFEY